MVIPNDPSLYKAILASEHDSQVADHWGMDRTDDLVRQNFWWPDMDTYIRGYVSGCRQCQQNKNPRHGVHGLLQPLEVKWKP